jgi:hypothetical protein
MKVTEKSKKKQIRVYNRRLRKYEYADADAVERIQEAIENHQLMREDVDAPYVSDENMDIARDVVEDLNQDAFKRQRTDEPRQKSEEDFDAYTTPDRRAPTPAMQSVSNLPGKREPRPINTRLAMSLKRKIDETEMDVDEPMSMALVATSSGATTAESRKGNRETLVKYDARAEMGIFTETRTAYLPVTFYLSVNRPQLKQSIPLKIRMDWPHGILTGNTLIRQYLWLDNDKLHVRSRGLSNDMALQAYRRPESGSQWVTAVPALFHEGSATNGQIWNIGQLHPFPCTIVGAQPANNPTGSTNQGDRGSGSYGAIVDDKCVPAYRRWYAKQYGFAHCMETDYRITYTPAESNNFSNIHVFQGLNVTSENNANVIPENEEYDKVQHWPNLKLHRVFGKTTERSSRPYVISGTWKDSDTQINRMIQNQEDIKTWEKLDTTDFATRANSYREDMLLMHYMDPEGLQTCFNVKVELRYKVQFKDLGESLRYLGTGDSIVLSSNDCIQIPRPGGNSGPQGNPERIHASGVTAL